MRNSVLIVDDSPALHKLVRVYLDSELLDIHSALDGESALSKAVDLRPSLILLDVDMPKPDGFEVCRRLKGNPATATTPIIFVTADTLLNDKIKGLDMGAVDYITKPFKPEELKARVKSSLRSRSNSDKTIMVDNLTGLWNQTYLDLHLKAQLSMARRTNQPLACVMSDIDHLDKINSEHGHAFGDEILRNVANIFISHRRIEDTVCHLGNGKFVALLPGTNRAGAANLADRIRLEIERQLRHHGKTKVDTTCSFGVTDTQADTETSLLDLADAALYRAKQSGPNTVSVNRPTAVQVGAII